MPEMIVIRARGGPKTTDRILELIAQHPQGISNKELSNKLNRPISMVNICLKPLVQSRQIRAELQDGYWVYFSTTGRLK